MSAVAAPPRPPVTEAPAIVEPRSPVTTFDVVVLVAAGGVIASIIPSITPIFAASVAGPLLLAVTVPT
ncbi:MAG: hypothetical protein M3137_04525, partial [Actinomycetota bacterium]|nr:hypothetical protein [Actinomycetota bacterium]